LKKRPNISDTFVSSGSPVSGEETSSGPVTEKKVVDGQNLETIGVLASGIAHDFNNVLITISGYAEMLLEDLVHDRELSEKAGKILEAVIKARSIADKILTLGRRSVQEKVPVNISEVLTETLGFIKSAIPSNIVVRSHIPLKNVKVLSDPVQLFRVFLNLLTNAIKAMEQTGGTISINLDVVKGKLHTHVLKENMVSGRYVLITFKDTGTGMEASQAERIFEPYFTTREAGKGTGLGLSVTKDIINEMKGEILVSSRKGEGSVFRIYFPVLKKIS
jgi:two-component system, cell cycle sensor histidine kinase and response regulator CckA